MIRRGTTPTHIFCTNIDLSQAKALYVTYYQVWKVVIEKNLEDCVVTNDSVTVTLSQKESLSLNDKQSVEIQIRAVFNDGTAVASNIMTATVGRILKGGVI